MLAKLLLDSQRKLEIQDHDRFHKENNSLGASSLARVEKRGRKGEECGVGSQSVFWCWGQRMQ